MTSHPSSSFGPPRASVTSMENEDLSHARLGAASPDPWLFCIPAQLVYIQHICGSDTVSQLSSRLQDQGGDSPDSFVPSSSPESVVGVQLSRYPDLSLVKEEPLEPAPSPIIPLLPSRGRLCLPRSWVLLSLTPDLQLTSPLSCFHPRQVGSQEGVTSKLSPAPSFSRRHLVHPQTGPGRVSFL